MPCMVYGWRGTPRNVVDIVDIAVTKLCLQLGLVHVDFHIYSIQ